MKKLILILAVLVVAFASCERKNIHQPKDNSTENTARENSSFWKTLDLCYVENGKLFFYSIKDDDAAQFVNETDSILDALYSEKDGMLYYNVVKDDYLVLKCLDLNDTDPMPEQLVEWGVPVNVGACVLLFENQSPRPSAVHWPTTQCGVIRSIAIVLCPE